MCIYKNQNVRNNIHNNLQILKIIVMMCKNMEKDRCEQLANQFFINNVRQDALNMKSTNRKYLNTRDALATKLFLNFLLALDS